MTFKQAQAIGACVRKGEKGSMVVYANAITKTETDAKTEEDIERRIPFLKSYTVFNAAQIEGLPVPSVEPGATDRLTDADRIEKADAFFKAIDPALQHGGTRAYYMPALDKITLPPFAAFESAASYYSVFGHECIHWSGHSSRLNRLSSDGKGSEAYAREELVAELGAAFLCADLGISDQPREDHAAYIATWLKVLRNDKRAIVGAAAAAQRATNFLHEAAGTLDQAESAEAA